jgi:hypothetical protein
MDTTPHTPTPRPAARRRGRLRLAIVAGLGALALLAAACGDDSSSASTGAGGDKVTITSPADGAEVGRSVEVKMDTNFDIGQPDTGRKHIHLHVDGSPDYEIAYESTHTLQLDPGEHTIVAVVANADHSETDVRSTPVKVDVSGSSSGGGNSPATTSGTPGY